VAIAELIYGFPSLDDATEGESSRNSTLHLGNDKPDIILPVPLVDAQVASTCKRIGRNRVQPAQCCLWCQPDVRCHRLGGGFFVLVDGLAVPKRSPHQPCPIKGIRPDEREKRFDRFCCDLIVQLNGERSMRRLDLHAGTTDANRWR